MAWVDNPERDVRLLHWFDQHPRERDIVFSMGKSPTQRMEARPLLTKQECCLDAAKEIFSMDEDPAVRRAVLQNPNYFAGRIKYRIFKSWRVKYTKINWEIGAAASNTPYEGLDKKIRQSTQSFPLWKGLHVYWRTNPHFNFHCQNNLSEASPAKRPKLSADASSSVSARNRRSANSGNIVVRKQPTRSAGRKNNPAIAVQADVIVLDDETDGEDDSSSKISSKENEDKKDVKAWESARLQKRKREDEDGASTSALVQVDTAASLKHEEYMAELRIRDQENEILKMILKRMS